MCKLIIAPRNSRAVRFGKLEAAFASSGDPLNSCEFSYRTYATTGFTMGPDDALEAVKLLQVQFRPLLKEEVSDAG